MIDPLLILLVTLFVFFALPILFITFYFERIHKPLERAKIAAPKEVVVKEVVMIRCQYCGGLMPQAATQCLYCRAPRKM